MHLIVGGAYQGKYSYAKNCLEEKLEHSPSDGECSKYIVNALHKKVREAVSSLDDATEFDVAGFVNDLGLRADSIVVCDEVGLGVVPIERKDTVYRECVGLCLQTLAKQADRFERVVAGIPIRIK